MQGTQSNDPVFFILQVLLLLAAIALDETAGLEIVDETELKVIFTTDIQVKYFSETRTANYSFNTRYERPHALTYNSQNNVVYWTDNSHKQILQSSIFEDNVTVKVFVEDTGETLGIACDWITGNIFFVKLRNDEYSISTCNNDTRNCLQIVRSLEQMSGIVVNPHLGIMFWGEYQKSIMQAGMDGNNPHAILRVSNGYIQGLTLDFQISRLFWTDIYRNSIESCNMDGTDHMVIYKSSSQPLDPFFIDVWKNRVYWTSRSGDEMYTIQALLDCPISVSGEYTLSTDKFDGTNLTVVHRERRWIRGIFVMAEDKQQIWRPNPCKFANCSHLCTLSEDSLCTCFNSSGMKEDNFYCRGKNPLVRVAIVENEEVTQNGQTEVVNTTQHELALSSTEPTTAVDDLIETTVAPKSSTDNGCGHAYLYLFAIAGYVVLLVVIIGLVKYIVSQHHHYLHHFREIHVMPDTLTQDFQHL